jgi:hypothetical protein
MRRIALLLLTVLFGLAASAPAFADNKGRIRSRRSACRRRRPAVQASSAA